MRARVLGGFLVVALFCVGVATLSSSSDRSAEGSSAAPVIAAAQPDSRQPSVKEAMSTLFVANVGQFDSQVRFATIGTSTSIAFTDTGLTFGGATQQEKDDHQPRAHPRVLFDGGAVTTPVVLERQPTVVTYLSGQDARRATTARVLRYDDVWPGVSLEVESTPRGAKTTYRVAPGADPSSIRLQYEGFERVSVDDGELVAVAADGRRTRESAPVAWQDTEWGRRAVPVRWRGGDAGSEAPVATFHTEAYDPSLPLVIDPLIVSATGYFGDIDTDYGLAVKVDQFGRAHIGGYITDPDHGDTDGFVARVSVDGRALDWIVLFAGNGSDPVTALSLADGRVVVGGWTGSNDGSFPAIGGPDVTYNGGQGDGFVALLSTEGALIRSTLFGGADDDLLTDLDTDVAGNVFVVGTTKSTEATFPVVGGPDLTFNGFYDLFVAKLDRLTLNTVFSGYIGGSGYERDGSVVVSASGAIHVAGSTDNSPGFPTVVGPSLTPGTCCDGFVGKLDPSGLSWSYIGYLNGEIFDVYDLDVDATGAAYVVGSARSSFGPGGGPGPHHSSGESDGFVVKISPAGALVFAGFLGSSQADSLWGVAVQGDTVYVAGSVNGSAFLPSVDGGPDTTYGGGGDGYIAAMNLAGTVLWSTYFGGTSNETLFELDVDEGGDVSAVGIMYPLGGVPENPSPGSLLQPVGNADVAFVKISANPVPPPTSRFVPIAPQRILDTRQGFGPVAPGEAVDLQVTGRGGVPLKGATAVVLNITTTQTQSTGFLTVWPTGLPRPNASNLNVQTISQTVANMVTVALGAGGRVSIFTEPGGHLIADVAGYYEAAATASAGRFVPVSPSRLLDTRFSVALSADSSTSVAVRGVGPVPATNVAAVVLNVTVVSATAPGYLTVWPDGVRPTVSNVNATQTGQTVPNQVIVPLSDSGAISIYSERGSHVLVDIFGYFTAAVDPASSTGLFISTAPIRMFDTRFSSKVAPGGTLVSPIAGVGPVPAANASTVVLNITATQSTAPGFVTVYPAATPRPNVSTLNIELTDQTIPNHATIPLGANGSISLYSERGTHLLADLAGWYT